MAHEEVAADPEIHKSKKVSPRLHFKRTIQYKQAKEGERLPIATKSVCIYICFAWTPNGTYTTVHVHAHMI